ncbi:coiled-coil domain-containing glutamate-rich protein 1-like [Eriocheir sinensis]|uniref:coiled-coil domain-containing glutamate-rich protein 1-like n=1 Tax=Eriocheir sinensis TaxID=95602 RepID=UPI0021C8C9E7|nr:coiled-coil domain-containing glutamate-rich protein 1-like [Eriocheir sinensis]
MVVEVTHGKSRWKGAIVLGLWRVDGRPEEVEVDLEEAAYKLGEVEEVLVEETLGNTKWEGVEEDTVEAQEVMEEEVEEDSEVDQAAMEEEVEEDSEVDQEVMEEEVEEDLEEALEEEVVVVSEEVEVEEAEEAEVEEEVEEEEPLSTLQSLP